jgi:hypothetical protein
VVSVNRVSVNRDGPSSRTSLGLIKGELFGHSCTLRKINYISKAIFTCPLKKRETGLRMHFSTLDFNDPFHKTRTKISFRRIAEATSQKSTENAE